MVESNSSWPCQQFSARESPSNCMITSVGADKHVLFSAQLNITNPDWVSANQSLSQFNGCETSVFLGSGPTNETRGLFGQSIFRNQTPSMYQNPVADGKEILLPAGHVGKPFSCATSHAQQKRFLIFDRSGNETRFLCSSICAPAEVPVSGSFKPTCPPLKCEVEARAATMQPTYPEMPVFHEEFGENDVIVEDDMHEDTEEINALLYSDDGSDNNYFDDYFDNSDAINGIEDDEDEVNSTGHSPLTMNGDQDKRELGGDDMDEVAGAQGSRKRQRVSDAGKFSLTDRRAPSGLLNGYNVGIYSSCALYGERSPDTGSKRPRKDKIHDMLRVLESIIPGTKNKDPMVVLDEAINHLKRLKFQAKALYSEDAESSSCC